MVLARRHLTLEEFLALPEEKPALQYFEGRITQKMAPKGRHSALQVGLVKYFDRVGLPRQVARAFSALRTSYAGASPVPDVTVYRWERIPIDLDGEIADDFFLPPDIAIEIVSPGRAARRCAASAAGTWTMACRSRCWSTRVTIQSRASSPAVRSASCAART